MVKVLENLFRPTSDTIRDIAQYVLDNTTTYRTLTEQSTYAQGIEIKYTIYEGLCIFVDNVRVFKVDGGECHVYKYGEWANTLKNLYSVTKKNNFKDV